MKIDLMRLGTRSSDLARWQTDHVAGLLRGVYPALQTEIAVISTKGDQVLDTPLPMIGGKGLFTAELEAALRAGQIDLAVHSLKDLPTDDPSGLTIGAITQRENPADVLVSRDNHTLDTLPEGATIGTSSNRRAAQLLRLRPDLKLRDIRGNVNTRVRKAFDPNGSYDAIILAYAGITRIKMDHVISQVLSFEQMLPAPGQGALAVQCRDQSDTTAILTSIHDPVTAQAVIAERSFLAALGGGCSIPVAAYARPTDNGDYRLQGRVSAVNGTEQIVVEVQFTAHDISAAREAGQQLAREALAQGAGRILGALQ